MAAARLELRERLPVPAEYDQHLAHGHPSGQLRVTQRQGLGQVRTRLGVGVQLAGHLGGAPPPLRGVGVPAGQLQVAGHGRGRGGGRVALVPADQDVGRAAVQQPAPGQRGRLVGGPAQGLVGEAVGRRLAGREGGREVGGGISVSRDRASASSIASTISSSPRPLTARSRSASLSLPSTAAAVSICLAGSLTASSRVRSRSLTLAGRPPVRLPASRRPGPSPGSPPGPPAVRRASTYSRTSMGSPRVSASSRVHVDLGHPVQAEQRADRLGVQRPGLDGLADRLGFGLAERGPQHPQPARLLGLPAQHEQQRPVGEPAHQVGEQAERGTVRPVHVLHHHDAGRPALPVPGGGRPQGVRDRRVQPGHGHRAVQRRRGPRVRVRLRGGQRRDQPPGHRGRLRRERARQVGPDRERGPQQVGGQHERQPGLAVVAASRQHDGPGRGRLVAQLGDEPRLAAAGLAGDGHHPAAPAGGPPGRAQGGQLSRPADQRPRPGARHRGRGRHRAVRPRPSPDAEPARSRAAGAFEPPGAHVVVEPRGLGQRPDGQVPVQHAHQRPVLPHGRRTLPSPAMQPDDGLVSGFVQRVELQPAPGVPGGALERAVRDAGRDQPLQPPGERLPELLAHRRLPFLEVRAAAQGEPGQEVVPVQLHRPLERRSVRPHDQGLELAYVNPDHGRREGDGRPADDQPVAHRGGGHRQRAPQRRPSLDAVRLGPEQVGQLIAAVLAAGHREQREQRRRLPGVEGDRRAIPLDDRRPEQGQAEVCCHHGHRNATA